MFVSRYMASLEYGRPLGTGWQGSLGLRCVRGMVVVVVVGVGEVGERWGAYLGSV